MVIEHLENNLNWMFYQPQYCNKVYDNITFYDQLSHPFSFQPVAHEIPFYHNIWKIFENT